ncbi:MAG TPA: UDP-3-O-(3-hydroxymyristoyl)glucosamine N-acyltransferase [Candidatus Acidoferrales bacterium]|nr:UDP-3-O-(3-hydroxymyristoyl)glucosamine N-acyltransferase [Candidatus Acidoferrales bacterium]
MTRKAAELAQYLGLELQGDPNAPLSGVANPEDAAPEDLIYADSARHFKRAESSRAVCVLAQPTAVSSRKTILKTANPKLAFAKAAAWLAPPAWASASIHSTAVIGGAAKVAKTATIGAYVVIEDDVVIGEGTWIEPFCFIGKGSRIGAKCRLHPHVTLYAHSELGNRVELHSGAVIGGDGFGYVFGEGRQWKFPQFGKVIIDDDVEIGSNTTIDRGSLGLTHIKSDSKIDNLVQVGHNVEIGEHSILVSQVGISGSTKLGKGVVVAGQAGFGDHAVVEDNAVIGGQAGILPGKVIRSGQVVWGTPARPLDKFKEQHAWFARLPELARRLEAVEDAIEKSAESASE